MPSAIDGINSNTFSTPAPTGPGNQLGRNEFLKLLLAQLANQDPLAPTTNEAFIAQLAQFSSLEAAEGANARLDTLLLAQATANQTSSASFIGKDIRHGSRTVVLGTEGMSFDVDVAGAATKVTATIKDADGKVVKTVELKDVQKGTVPITWNGVDADGKKRSPGDFTVALTAEDTKGNPVTVEPRSRGRVTGVTYENGYPELLVGSLKVKMNEIKQVLSPADP